MSNRQEAAEQYGKALKRGKKYYKDCVLKRRYPYPHVLDEILSNAAIAGQVELGLVEQIPSEQITGTKTAGRRSVFTGNFMPLLEADTEFATKWIELCAAHLGDEGIRDPIRCFEYLGRFYVQEGNKRVSVLKSYDSPYIPGYVTRVIPMWSEDPEIQTYYEFMDSYRLTGLYQVVFSRLGSFAKMQAALGYEKDHTWTADERLRFMSCYSYFRDAFVKMKGDTLPITVADALLVWLKVYDIDSLRTLSGAELSKNLSAIWPDVKMLASPEPVSMSTEPVSKEKPGLLGQLFRPKQPERLNVAFINERGPEDSDWARAHDLGRQYLETVMSDQVAVQVFDGVLPGDETVVDAAVDNGAQLIITTTPPLIGICRKAAAKYPGLRILNCSAVMPYAGVRTYYSRIYEGKFITGAIAGALSRDGQIGYVASNPIFGVPASINAFALGARMTNPDAHIRLCWSCVEEDAMDILAKEGVTLISNRDIPTPDRIQEPWGLCRVQKDGSYVSLASPYWHWGNFYVKLVHSILGGGWDALSAQNGGRAVNYWWGMDSQTVGVLLHTDVPAGVRQLAGILQKEMTEGSLNPFQRPIRSQDGVRRSDGTHWFSPEEILHMDWFCDYVEGGLPPFESILPFARDLVRLQGVYRDSIPPEKEGTIL